MKKHFNLLVICIVCGLLISCAWGTQPVIWKKTAPINFNKKLTVNVTKATRIPDDEISYIKTTVESEVNPLFNNSDSTVYKLNVSITRYDEGSAGLRFLLAGLGQMYLYGTVTLVDTVANVTVREGEFKKNYSVGGIVGASATVRTDMSSRLGKDIASALKDKNKK